MNVYNRAKRKNDTTGSQNGEPKECNANFLRKSKWRWLLGDVGNINQAVNVDTSQTGVIYNNVNVNWNVNEQ